MPNPLVDDAVYKMTVVCSTAFQVSNNVLYLRYRKLTAPDITEEAAAASLSDDIAEQYKAVMSSAAKYEGVFLQRVFPTTGPVIQDDTDNGPGVLDDGLMSTQTAGLFTIRTGLGGRRHRGRKYIPFPDEVSNTSVGRPSADYLTVLSNLATELTTVFPVAAGGGTGEFDPVLYNPESNLFDLITGYTLRKNWATQRRRSQVNRPDANPFA